MQRIKRIVMGAMLTVTACLGLIISPAAGAVDIYGQCQGNTQSTVCASQNDDVSNLVKTIINVLLFVVGAASVIMIIVGGITYAVSAGEQSLVTRAKHTITYAVVGLVVAFIAFAIVNWVVGLFNPAPANNTTGPPDGCTVQQYVEDHCP